MEKILIIDDEAFIRENVERVLGEEGYQVLPAAGGRMLWILSPMRMWTWFSWT